MERRAFIALALATAAGIGAAPAKARHLLPARRVPGPVAALATRWDTDPWSLGAYSALPPGTSARAREILGELVLDDRVVLAGEFTSLVAPATTNGALESGRQAARRLLDRGSPRRVVVIGAGIAGAGAADRLRASGVEAIVLEARDRVGGRIHTDRRWGAPIELGAAWIHGVTGNPVTALAQASGLEIAPMDWENSVIRDTMTGRPSSSAEAVDARLSRLTDDLADAEAPAGTSTAAWLRGRGWRPGRLADWAQAVEITQEYGLDPADLGVRAFSEGDWQRGGDALVGGGYATVVDRLLDGIDVRLTSPVASLLSEGDQVIARLESGGAIVADAAVVAVPLALLQANRPDLGAWPDSARRALGSLRTGSLEKVVLRFTEQWWGDLQAIEVVGGGAPGAPAGSQAALRWTELVSISELVGFPALVAFSGGSAARTRPSSDAACVAEAMAALRAGYRA